MAPLSNSESDTGHAAHIQADARPGPSGATLQRISAAMTWAGSFYTSPVFKEAILIPGDQRGEPGLIDIAAEAAIHKSKELAKRALSLDPPSAAMCSPRRSTRWSTGCSSPRPSTSSTTGEPLGLELPNLSLFVCNLQ